MESAAYLILIAQDPVYRDQLIVMNWSWISDPQAYAELLALLALEVVLGIDSIVFLSILASRVPPQLRPKTRQIGLALALVVRLLLLFFIAALIHAEQALFRVLGHDFSIKDVVLIAGGLFLIHKAVHEIHGKLEGADADPHRTAIKNAFGIVIAQIVVIDLVFSIDSVITAVGMLKQIQIMVISIAFSIGFMLAFAGKVSDFVEAHPTVKMLALAFLVLIGANLLPEGFGHPIEKGFTYFALAFSVGVEMLNLRAK